MALHIALQPSDFYGDIGDTASFHVEAVGTNLTYQWQFQMVGTDTWRNSGMTGNRTSTISVPVTSAKNGQKYRCIVTSGSNSVTSEAGTLKIAHKISKVVYGNRTLIDLTTSTVTAEKLYKGAKAFGADGTAITGTAEVTVNNEVLIMPSGLVTPL